MGAGEGRGCNGAVFMGFAAWEFGERAAGGSSRIDDASSCGVRASCRNPVGCGESALPWLRRASPRRLGTTAVIGEGNTLGACISRLTPVCDCWNFAYGEDSRPFSRYRRNSRVTPSRLAVADMLWFVSLSTSSMRSDTTESMENPSSGTLHAGFAIPPKGRRMRRPGFQSEGGDRG